MHNNKHNAAFPTFPVQDQFGSTIIQFGCSKIELLTAILSAPMIKDERLLPETIAEYAYQVAAAIIDHCDEEAKKDFTKSKSENLILGK